MEPSSEMAGFVEPFGEADAVDGSGAVFAVRVCHFFVAYMAYHFFVAFKPKGNMVAPLCGVQILRKGSTPM